METAPAEHSPDRFSPLLPGEISRSERDGVYVVTVRGELDISNVGVLRESVMEIPNTALGLVVDLAAASFIDSSTVGLLFELRQSLARRSQGLRVVCPPASPAARALELMSFAGATCEQHSVPDAVVAICREQAPQA